VAVYQQKARERIKKSMRRFKGLAERARAAKASEADTRTIVTSFLGEALGWDTFTDMTGEYRIRGNYADFALKDGADLLAIIEVKASGTTLAAKHLYQAVSYAANEGVDWVLLTNGDDWHAYRILFNKPVEHVLVFKASLTDPDMKPAEKLELFYLLTKEARRAAELDAYYERCIALSGANIARTLLGEKLLTTLRAELRRSTGQKVTAEELAVIMAASVLRPEIQGEDTARLIKKAANVGKKPARRTAAPAEPVTVIPESV
jgi:predicted type IV restriction endonuclease